MHTRLAPCITATHHLHINGFSSRRFFFSLAVSFARLPSIAVRVAYTWAFARRWANKTNEENQWNENPSDAEWKFECDSSIKSGSSDSWRLSRVVVSRGLETNSNKLPHFCKSFTAPKIYLFGKWIQFDVRLSSSMELGQAESTVNLWPTHSPLLRFSSLHLEMKFRFCGMLSADSMNSYFVYVPRHICSNWCGLTIYLSAVVWTAKHSTSFTTMILYIMCSMR